MKPSLLSVLVAAALAGGCSQGLPPADPLADEISAEQQMFAAQVDRICATNYNRSVFSQELVYARADADRWPKAKTEALTHEIWARNQANTHRSVIGLGNPPENVGLFRRWAHNVRRRGELFHAQSLGWATDDMARVSEAALRIRALKIDANYLGQMFGLRVCTSNGPSLEPGDEAGTAAAYLGRLNGICLRRNHREDLYAARDELTTNQIVNLAVSETLKMSTIPPRDEEQYALRRRILALKRSLDSRARWMITRTARSEHPNATFARTSAQAEAHGDRVHAQLAALGLPDCGNWGATPAPSEVGDPG